MIIGLKDAVEEIAKEKNVYLSGDDKFKLGKIEDEAESKDDAIKSLKTMKNIRLGFSGSDYGSIKNKVTQT